MGLQESLRRSRPARLPYPPAKAAHLHLGRARRRGSQQRRRLRHHPQQPHPGQSGRAGDGGGIRVVGANGADVAVVGSTAADWYAIDIINNIIVNNVSAPGRRRHLAGGRHRVRIINNTVANNDSSATAFAASPPRQPIHAANRRHCQPPAQHRPAGSVRSDVCGPAVAEQHYLPEPVLVLRPSRGAGRPLCEAGGAVLGPGSCGKCCWLSHPAELPSYANRSVVRGALRQHPPDRGGH